MPLSVEYHKFAKEVATADLFLHYLEQKDHLDTLFSNNLRNVTTYRVLQLRPSAGDGEEGFTTNKETTADNMAEPILIGTCMIKDYLSSAGRCHFGLPVVSAAPGR